jgi:hypothetical protein
MSITRRTRARCARTAVVVLLVSAHVDAAPQGAAAQDRLADARVLLKEFVRPGADHAGLSARLRPSRQDYDAVFTPAAAAKLQAAYDPAWDRGVMVVKGKPDQTSVLVWSATAEEVKSWSGAAREHFPGGYQKVGAHLRPGVRLYAFKFVVPGETLGMAFDGLAHVNGHWCIFPKPFRALE